MTEILNTSLLLILATVLLAGCASTHRHRWNQRDEVERARSTAERVMWL